MEQKNIVIIVLIAIVVLAAAVGVMLLSPYDAKQDTKLDILSNETLYKWSNLTVKLTDINGTGISDETVNVTIKDKNGGIYQTSLLTNGSGIGVLELNSSAGNYTVNITFEGDDKYNSANATQRLEIKEVVVEEKPVYVESSSASTQTSSEDDGIAEYRDFVSWDYAPGEHIRETTYKNGDIKHEYDDGSYDYYDSSAKEWRYKDADGREGSMQV